MCQVHLLTSQRFRIFFHSFGSYSFLLGSNATKDNKMLTFKLRYKKYGFYGISQHKRLFLDLLELSSASLFSQASPSLSSSFFLFVFSLSFTSLSNPLRSTLPNTHSHFYFSGLNQNLTVLLLGGDGREVVLIDFIFSDVSRERNSVLCFNFVAVSQEDRICVLTQFLILPHFKTQG